MNVNKHWKTHAKCNDVIAYDIFARSVFGIDFFDAH